MDLIMIHVNGDQTDCRLINLQLIPKSSVAYATYQVRDIAEQIRQMLDCDKTYEKAYLGLVFLRKFDDDDDDDDG